MPSTEHDIFSHVDGCFNHIDGKPCFRYAPHKMIKIRVRIEIRVFQIVYTCHHVNHWMHYQESYNYHPVSIRIHVIETISHVSDSGCIMIPYMIIRNAFHDSTDVNGIIRIQESKSIIQCFQYYWLCIITTAILKIAI